MHPETLTSKAKNLIDPLSRFENYYLAGGTGLALQLGHRKSVDFDFFTPNKVHEILSKLNSLFPENKTQVIVNQANQLTAEIKGVKTSFIKYPFPVFDQFKNWQGFKIISFETIAAMKAYTIGRRATFKDYVDLYYLLKENVTNLKEIIKKSNKVFGTAFNDRLFLEQLVYLEDIEEQKIMFIKKPVTKKEIKTFFENQIKDFSFD